MHGGPESGGGTGCQNRRKTPSEEIRFFRENPCPPDPQNKKGRSGEQNDQTFQRKITIYKDTGSEKER
jgi:hypothetical protein